MADHTHLTLDGRETARIAGQTDGYERLPLFTPAPTQLPGQMSMADRCPRCAARHAADQPCASEMGAVRGCWPTPEQVAAVQE